VRIYYAPAYAMAVTAFDTTRKARWVAESLQERPIAGVELAEPEPLDDDAISIVHAPAYVRTVRTGEPSDLARSSGLSWDPNLFPAVCASNGGAVAAALHVLDQGGVAGSLSSGLHHARTEYGAGFCTFNGLALAADATQRAGAWRILVLDLDAHCGGGTHEILAGDEGIVQLDVAVSGFDDYLPAPPWTLDIVSGASAYLDTIRRRLDALGSDGGGVDLVLYNAGMDPYEGCFVGGLRGIDHEVLAARERLVFGWARSHALPVAFVLAGGYPSGEDGERVVVDLHRETILAASG
jgi:acetoin utilization deacetylase AcuC-like enzyme